MSDLMNENGANGPALNTDRELYREDTGDPAGSYYENSLHVTADGRIGMNVGGRVVVMPIAAWHALATRPVALDEQPSGCDHEWSERGSPGDRWQECWLCGVTRDRPTSPGGHS